MSWQIEALGSHESCLNSFFLILLVCSAPCHPLLEPEGRDIGIQEQAQLLSVR